MSITTLFTIVTAFGFAAPVGLAAYLVVNKEVRHDLAKALEFGYKKDIQPNTKSTMKYWVYVLQNMGIIASFGVMFYVFAFLTIAFAITTLEAFWAQNTVETVYGLMLSLVFGFFGLQQLKPIKRVFHEAGDIRNGEANER